MFNIHSDSLKLISLVEFLKIQFFFLPPPKKKKQNKKTKCSDLL